MVYDSSVEYETLRCLAILTNVDETVLSLEVPAPLTIAKWSADRAVRVLSQLEFLAEHEVHARLTGRYHAITKDSTVLVVEGDVQIPSVKYPNERMAAEDALVECLDEEINLWRLVKDSSVEIVAIYLFHKTGEQLVFSFAQSSTWFPEQSVLTLSTSDVTELAQLRFRSPLPFTQPYLELARDHFVQTFRTDDCKLKFLLLSIALEVLFNDGPSDIGYRIARGVAVVLARTREEGEQHFAQMKRFYKLRSDLVHKGVSGEIDLPKVLQLRSLLRRVIVGLALRGLDKTATLREIAASAYGAWPGT